MAHQSKSFMQHPYWRNVLGMPVQGKNDIIIKMTQASTPRQTAFLTLVVEGFYPISYSSPLSFYRVSELSHSEKTRFIANNIYEVELGKHPFIKGGKSQNVLHCEQLKHTIASLVEGLEITLPRPDAFPLAEKINIPESDLCTSLAICEVIEHTAPDVINYMQDFVLQWQYLTNRPSNKINRTYLDEHNLTEGNESADQHIGMVDNMLRPHADLVNSAAYAKANFNFHSACITHLDTVYSKMLSLAKE